ncbi:MAG: hypothetical protein K940chlam1_00501 [Candidatus Anoxychlamydiales bacterium]|nr:hypothetical protein [Candidatus Anoxychlamydiales bacterium]NGX35529.1 hypothetical protein [Candidatus Anoxychlamydiales bacterium]
MTSFNIFFAYADPGTGMLVWQVLAAFGVGAAFYFRSFLKKIISLFKKKKIEKKDE